MDHLHHTESNCRPRDAAAQKTEVAQTFKELRSSEGAGLCSERPKDTATWSQWNFQMTGSC